MKNFTYIIITIFALHFFSCSTSNEITPFTNDICVNATGIWNLTPNCTEYQNDEFGVWIDVNERFDDSILVICDSNNLVINFGDEQSAYASLLNDQGDLLIPNQIISIDFNVQGAGNIDVDVFGDGHMNLESGVLNLTFAFELFENVIDSTSCMLFIQKL